MSKDINEVRIRRESLFQSIVNDVFSLGFVTLLFWFNYNFIGGSYLVNFIIMVIMFLYICKLAIKFKNNEDKRFVDYKNVSDEKIKKIIEIVELENE